MMGFDKMLAGMIGLTPDQLQAMATGMAKAATDGTAMLKEIRDQNALILERLERLENVNGNDQG